MDKDSIRKEIDTIDTQILNLLEERVARAKAIGRIKVEKGEDVFDSGRESLVFKRLLEK